MRELKIVSIWNPKGGQGKSMLAINIAGAAVEMGLKPLVIDQDQQGTSHSYFKSGKLPFDVLSDFPKERPDADLLIIDHQASDWSLPQGDLVIMPVKPARDQYAVYEDARQRAQLAGKKIFTVVTDTSEHRKSEKRVKDALVSQGAKAIPSSGVFSRAADDHVSIYDTSMNKAYKVSERRKEITAILASVLMDTENTKFNKNESKKEKALESA